MNEIKKKKSFDADLEADMLLEKQFELGRSSKIANVLTAVLCFGFIFAFAILFWIIPDKAKSESENRELQQAPAFSLESLISGEFTGQFATYMADQFPARDFFVGIKGLSETVQLKSQNNDTFVTSDGYLIDRDDYFHAPQPQSNEVDTRITAANIGKNIRYVASFDKMMNDAGVDFVAAFVGRKQDVLTDKLPATYGSTYSDEVWSYISDTAEKRGLSYLDLRTYLKDLENDSLYYRTDHHWTTEGAYEAYVKIMESFGETPYSREDFTIECATNEFYGTTYQAAGIKWVAGDTISYWRYESDDELVMSILDAPDKEGNRNYEGYEGVTYEGDYATFSGVYVRDYLSVTDKYASFIGGNNSYTEIRLPGADRETMVIAKDSFAHSIAPFLARHYDLVIVDFRSFPFSVAKLCEQVGADKALVLCNLDTLGQGAYMGNLNAVQLFENFPE